MDTQALVIIDMQPNFSAARDEETISAVLDAIDAAKEANVPIFILELKPEQHGHTIELIVEAVDLYDKVYFLTKTHNDGATEVEDEVASKDIEVSSYAVCGVNISFCVQATIYSFVHTYNRDVTVLKDACNCDTIHCSYHKSKDDSFAASKIYNNSKVVLLETIKPSQSFIQRCKNKLLLKA